MRSMAFGFVLLFIVARSVAAADSPSKSKQSATMYLIHLKMLEEWASESTEERTEQVLASPAVAVAEDVDANFHVGGLRKTGGEQLKFGTMAKAWVKRADDGTLIVSGFVEVSTVGEQEDGFVARQAKSLHFSRTVKLGETLKLPSQPATNRRLRLEVVVDRIDETHPLASRTATAK